MTFKDDFRHAFADRLDQCLTHRDMSLEEFAQRVVDAHGQPFDPATITAVVDGSEWELIIPALAEILQVDAAWLAFGGKGASAPAPSWFVARITPPNSLTKRKFLKLVT